LADLVNDPKGLELEDFVAAHFVSRGCYVETGIKERKPAEILELDIFWSDYRRDPPERHPVEVKSGDWGLGEVFKFFGWTRYLGLVPGQFVHKEACGRLDPGSLAHVRNQTGITFLHIPTPQGVDASFKPLGLPEPKWEALPALWRYSLWAQRRLLKSLGESIKENICVETAKTAKEYHHLINDAVFFVPDVRDRVGDLLNAHFEHQQLALTAAYEIETGKLEFRNPPQTRTFKKALYGGSHFPIQACLFLAHRARLYILKALVDYWLARQRGEITDRYLRLGKHLIDMSTTPLSNAMLKGLNELSQAKSFRLFPVFWQIFLWSWGGFLLTDRMEQEHDALSKETGVPIDEIPVALTAFDKLYPTDNGWFRRPMGDSRSVLMLMPAVMRGIGSGRRKFMTPVENYKDLGYADETGPRLAADHNALVRILECAERELVK